MPERKKLKSRSPGVFLVRYRRTYVLNKYFCPNKKKCKFKLTNSTLFSSTQYMFRIHYLPTHV